MKVNSSTDVFQGISLQLQSNYMVEQLFLKHPSMAAFSAHIWVMPKKGIIRKFVEVFTNEKTLSNKVENKFRLLKQI